MDKKDSRLWLRMDADLAWQVRVSADQNFRPINDHMRYLLTLGLKALDAIQSKERFGKTRQEISKPKQLLASDDTKDETDERKVG